MLFIQMSLTLKGKMKESDRMIIWRKRYLTTLFKFFQRLLRTIAGGSEILLGEFFYQLVGTWEPEYGTLVKSKLAWPVYRKTEIKNGTEAMATTKNEVLWVITWQLSFSGGRVYWGDFSRCGESVNFWLVGEDSSRETRALFL